MLQRDFWKKYNLTPSLPWDNCCRTCRLIWKLFTTLKKMKDSIKFPFKKSILKRRYVISDVLLIRILKETENFDDPQVKNLFLRLSIRFPLRKSVQRPLFKTNKYLINSCFKQQQSTTLGLCHHPHII